MSVEGYFRGRLGQFQLDVAFELPARGISAVFGPSGSGKTTLLRAIAGLQQFADGRLTVAGQAWQNGAQFLPAPARRVGYIFQEASLFPHLSVSGNIEYARKRAGLAPDDARLRKLQALLGIQLLAGRAVQQLSGGERKRVAMARALAAQPRLLLLDEPLAGLDLARKRDIMPYLQALHRELDIPVILVSHDVHEVARLADYLLLLEAGQVQSAGPLPSQLTALDSPLAQQPDSVAVLEARVLGHDREWQLTELTFSGGRLLAPLDEAGAGPVRVGIAARDVSITLSAAQDSSILNVLPATVEDWREQDTGQVLVALVCGSDRLLARITRKSCHQLALAPGQAVFAQVKSLALLA